MTTCIEIEANGDYTEYEFEVEFSASKIVPAKIWGPPEHCYPAEGGEVEITSIACSETPKIFSVADFVFLKNWTLVADGHKPIYSVGDLEDECLEEIEDYEPDPPSGTDDYRDNRADDY